MRERLRNLRTDRDLSQKDMAEQLRVAQTTYSDYELGKLNIPTGLLVELAVFFNTNIDYLLGLTDTPEPYPRSKPYQQKQG